MTSIKGELCAPVHKLLMGEEFYDPLRDLALKKWLIDDVDGNMLLFTTKSLLKKLKACYSNFMILKYNTFYFKRIASKNQAD